MPYHNQMDYLDNHPLYTNIHTTNQTTQAHHTRNKPHNQRKQSNNRKYTQTTREHILVSVAAADQKLPLAQPLPLSLSLSVSLLCPSCAVVCHHSSIRCDVCAVYINLTE